MWVQYIPDERIWRELPVVLLAALSVWGLVSPRTQWPVLWGWQRRYRHLQEPRERAETIRRSVIVPLIIGVVLGLILWPQR
ncbi:MAG: hypothetical protein J2P14_12125 [Acidothermales bacterium]|nr:hypothetical protein [Acidothermales bacterium]